MKKFLTILIALIMISFSFVLIPSEVFSPENHNDSHYSKVTIKNDKFTGDYTRKINGVKVEVERDFTYSRYLEIKGVIENTPTACFKNLEKIVLTPRHPCLAANGSPDKELLDYVEAHPNISGLHVGIGVVGTDEITSILYLRDRDDIMSSYIHELAHHVGGVIVTDGKTMCESDEFKKLCRQFRTKVGKNDDAASKWFAKQPDSELFAYFAECIYADDGSSYHKIVMSFPKIIEYYEDQYNLLKEEEQST